MRRALFALLIAPCVAAYYVTVPLSFERSLARNPRGRGCCAPQMALESAMQVARGAVVEAAAVARFVAQSYSNFEIEFETSARRRPSRSTSQCRNPR